MSKHEPGFISMMNNDLERINEAVRLAKEMRRTLGFVQNLGMGEILEDTTCLIRSLNSKANAMKQIIKIRSDLSVI